MFTGLVEKLGTLVGRTSRGPGARLRIACAFEHLALGESIAVDGVCLTVQAITGDGFEADASKETLDRTTLGRVRLHEKCLHLERAVPIGGRMGGHIVTGHVDAFGTIVAKVPDGESLRMRVGFPSTLAPFIAEKGSIAVSGVSLTVNAVTADTFEVTLVPHTQAETYLAKEPLGGAVNLEVDPLARYVVRALRALREADSHSSDATLLGALGRSGYT